MINVSADFDRIKIKTYNCRVGERFFDPVRNKFIAISPEEVVRQRTIVFLRDRLEVPLDRMYVEDHLAHYGVQNENENKRMDIAVLKEDNTPLAVVECKRPSVSIDAVQVYKQAVDYATDINAEYIILSNGVWMQLFAKRDGRFQEINGVLTYSEMLKGKGDLTQFSPFQRLKMNQYYDLDFLKKQEWYPEKIGEDTPVDLIPAIINLDDCLLDYSHTLEGPITRHFEILSDLGVVGQNYDNASGGGLGTGYYRLFLVNDSQRDKQFTIGFTISATAKTVGSKKYGTRDGLSVLMISINDGDFDELSVQINLNKYMTITGDKAHITHNGAMTRKGARKQDLLNYIEDRSPEVVNGDMIDLGYLDTSKPLFVDNHDVKSFIGKAIEYAVYRDDYKHSL
jgi:hypothetical protein